MLVSEHSPDCAPLVPGEHFVSGTLENLALLADHLLRDEERLAAMRLAAYDHVRTELPMRPAAERLIAMAEDLARSPRVRRAKRGQTHALRARHRGTGSAPTCGAVPMRGSTGCTSASGAWGSGAGARMPS